MDYINTVHIKHSCLPLKKACEVQARIQGGGAFGACAPPPLSLMPNEKIYGD